MKRLLVSATVALLLTGFPAQAGPASDALSACLTKAANQDDQIILIRWMFSAMALHPQIKDLATISEDQRNKITGDAGAVFERLVTADCRSEVVTALKTDGSDALAQGFNAVGQMAAGGLFTAPEVSQGMAGLTAAVDPQKLKDIEAEAAQ